MTLEDDLDNELTEAFAHMLQGIAAEERPDSTLRSEDSLTESEETFCDVSDKSPKSQEPIVTQSSKVLEPDATSEEITQWVDAIGEQHRQFVASLEPSHKDKLPVAVVPEHIRHEHHGDPARGDTMYDAQEASIAGLTGVADLVLRSLRVIDTLKELPPPMLAEPQPGGAVPSSPSSSITPAPDTTPSVSAAIAHKDNLASLLDKAFGGDWISREMNRALQGNDIYLASVAMQLSRRLQSTPESAPEYRELQSSFGLVVLQLYELTHLDTHLDAGVGAVSLAMTGNVDDESPGAVVRVCNWTYAQRLVARREQSFERIQHAVDIATRTLQISRVLHASRASSAQRMLSLELAECLLDQYRAFGRLQDLQDALDLLPTSRPDGDIQDSQTFCVLSEIHMERFIRTWNLDDIDRALYYTFQVRDIDDPLIGPRPQVGQPPHPDAARGLHVTALVLAQRFKVVMDIADLDNAVTHARNAVAKCTESHPLYVVYLTDLALLLYQRFEADEELADLDECVERLSIAAHLPLVGTYVHYPARAAYGIALATRGDHKEDLAEIDEGIRQLQLARRAFSGGAQIEAQIERDLSSALFFRFQLTQGSDDLDEAIRYATSAFDRAPMDDQRRGALALELGEALAVRASRSSRHVDAEAAIGILRDVAKGTGRPSVRLSAAIQWAKVASARGPKPTLEALEVALDVLPLIAWAGSRMVVQYKTLARLSVDVGPWAAACALACGRADDAITYLERGRNVLWSQSLQLRPGHVAEQTQASKSTAGAEYNILSSFLASSADGPPEITPGMREDAARRNPKIMAAVDGMRSVYESMRAQAMAHPGYHPGDFERIESLKSMATQILGDASLHSAAGRWDTLRANLNQLDQDISKLDLRRDSRLAVILERGHIVFINIHSTRCDAIVLARRSEDVSMCITHVPLPDLSADEIQGWAEAIQVGMYDLQEGAIGVRDLDDVILIPILQGLWERMARPILAELSPKAHKRPMRVWWCPTGPLAFLPIHAAGPYEGKAPGLPELVVSSYIPTLHSLLRAHGALKNPFSMLAVGQPDTPGQSPLPAVQKELAVIKGACARRNKEPPTTLVGPAATAHSVSRALLAHTWLHFSCHAHQDPSYAFASAFFMHDGPLRLGALMQLDLSRVQFAFLSACLTSAGDERLPDESIHLAAGLQFAGVRSTIATLWSVDDRAAARTAERVYGDLLRDGVDEPDPLEAAEALHRAVGAMKAKGRPMVLWVPFVHTGL
ncbi:CHAT domain-containing protein [Lenzites betulinus]|nr:CHAT domain-containing protein [Lenzites betulinus]